MQERWTVEASGYGARWLVAGPHHLAALSRNVLRIFELVSGREVFQSSEAMLGARLADSPAGPIVAFAHGTTAPATSVRLEPGGIVLRGDSRDLARAAVVAFDWIGGIRWRLEVAGMINEIHTTEAGILLATDAPDADNARELVLLDPATGTIRTRSRAPCVDFVALGDRAFFEGATGVMSATVGSTPQTILPISERPALATVGSFVEVQATNEDETANEIWLLRADGTVVLALKTSGYAGKGIIDGDRYVHGERDGDGLALVARTLGGDAVLRTPLIATARQHTAVSVVAAGGHYVAGTCGQIYVIDRHTGKILSVVDGVEVELATADTVLISRPVNTLAAFSI